MDKQNSRGSRVWTKRISIEARPNSGSGSAGKSRKTQRRRRTPTSNAVVFASKPPKQPHLHSTTNFPLFSHNLSQARAPVSQTAKLSYVSTRNKETPSHNLATHNTRVNVVNDRVRKTVEIGSIARKVTCSPTTVEEVSRNVESRLTNRSLVSTITVLSSDSRKIHISPRQDVPSPCTSVSPVFSEKDWDPDCFPFQYLPVDCKLKVFSFLSSHDKGRASQVCVDWSQLMQTGGLWAHVSFSDFPFWCITTDEHNCLGNCYIRYRVRVKQFFAYLKDLQPILRSLEFKFDIGLKTDGFLQPLENLIDQANTKELKYACMNWKETPMRPFWRDPAQSARCDEVMTKHRDRQKLFVDFFDRFTNKCPKVETLVLPFDWSDKSVEYLLRLKNLKSLVLEKYFVFQKLCQDLLDKLLAGLALRQLMLEVWTPSGHGLVFFSVCSRTLEYLDISQSRGFYLCAVILPKLKVFRVARHPWNGPLVVADRINVPCIYDILVDGAPNLEKINEHYLESSWQEKIYPQLHEVLKSVCSCRKHKSGWAM